MVLSFEVDVLPVIDHILAVQCAVAWAGNREGKMQKCKNAKIENIFGEK